MLCHAGTLPSRWGVNRAFPALTSLKLIELPLQGTLPTAWGGRTAFPSLLELCLGVADEPSGHMHVEVSLSGSLPAQWGSNGSFPLLEHLTIANLLPGPGLSGSLASEWGSPEAFQHLRELLIANTQGGISGTVHMLVMSSMLSSVGRTVLQCKLQMGCSH